MSDGVVEMRRRGGCGADGGAHHCRRPLLLVAKLPQGQFRADDSRGAVPCSPAVAGRAERALALPAAGKRLEGKFGRRLTGVQPPAPPARRLIFYRAQSPSCILVPTRTSSQTFWLLCSGTCSVPAARMRASRATPLQGTLSLRLLPGCSMRAEPSATEQRRRPEGVIRAAACWAAHGPAAREPRDLLPQLQHDDPTPSAGGKGTDAVHTSSCTVSTAQQGGGGFAPSGDQEHAPVWAESVRERRLYDPLRLLSVSADTLNFIAHACWVWQLLP